MWVGIETQKDVIHYTTCNINYVYCFIVYFILMLIFANMEDSIKNIYKRKKNEKLPNFVLLCGIKFYVTTTQPYWSL